MNATSVNSTDINPRTGLPYAGPNPGTQAEAVQAGAPEPAELEIDRQDPVDLGGEPEREVKLAPKLTGGRHVTSPDGVEQAKHRKDHLKKTRKETEKSFERSHKK